jgi:hypothetical protein
MWTTATVLRLLASTQLASLALVVFRGDRRDKSAQAARSPCGAPSPPARRNLILDVTGYFE